MVIPRAKEAGPEKPSAWNGEVNGDEEGTAMSSAGLQVEKLMRSLQVEKLMRIQARTWAGMDWLKWQDGVIGQKPRP